jgi:O-antigen ligase
MDLSQFFGPEQGGTTSLIGFTSWDNNYACDLIELGTTGFILEIILFFTIVKALFKNWRESDRGSRVLQGGIMVACLVFMYAMTTVDIFSPQLKFLFWPLVAVGSSFSRVVANQAAEAETVLQPGELAGSVRDTNGLTTGESTI